MCSSYRKGKDMDHWNTYDCSSLTLCFQKRVTTGTKMTRGFGLNIKGIDIFLHPDIKKINNVLEIFLGMILPELCLVFMTQANPTLSPHACFMSGYTPSCGTKTQTSFTQKIQWYQCRFQKKKFFWLSYHIFRGACFLPLKELELFPPCEFLSRY